MSYESNDLRGVGGWLAFFAVAFGLLSPAYSVFSLWPALYGDPSLALTYAAVWRRLELFEWALTGISVAAAWFVVWRLCYVQTWSTVRITIAAIWLLGPLMMIGESLGVAAMLNVPFDQLMAAGGPEAVRPFIFAIVWTAYFLRSERVANTYPRHPEAEEMAETFG